MGCGASSKVIQDYNSPAELLNDLRESGVLEDCEIVVGIDATKSNETSGMQTFAGRNLHDVEFKGLPNQYMSVVRTATKFFQRDLDAIIPLYMFGSTQAAQRGGAMFIRECKGSEELAATYYETIGTQTLSGPTTFVPLINEVIGRVKATKKFHLLLIITDGAVQDEKAHYACFDEAAKHPLAIVTVGVGDGGWETMQAFDDNIPAARPWDNFQFVQFKRIVGKEVQNEMEDEFFFRAFMEVPKQYKACKKVLGYRPPAPGFGAGGGGGAGMPAAMPPQAAAAAPAWQAVAAGAGVGAAERRVAEERKTAAPAQPPGM